MTIARPIGPLLWAAIALPILLGGWHLNLALRQALTLYWSGDPSVSWAAVIVGPASTLPAIALSLRKRRLGACWLLAGAILSFVTVAFGPNVSTADSLQFLLQVSLPMIIVGFGLLNFSWLGSFEPERDTSSSFAGRASEGSGAILRLGAILHALAVLILWIALVEFDLDVISARAWLIIAYLWLLWPLTMLYRPIPRSVISIAFSIALLSPCITTIYAFTSWSVLGFAR